MSSSHEAASAANQGAGSEKPLPHWLERPWMPPLILVVFFCLYWTSTCGLWDLWGADETRYTMVARELLGRGNWFLLTLFGEPYDQKPPLPFWLIAGTVKVFGGISLAWAARLPSVLAAVGAIVGTFAIGRHLYSRRVGWVAALLTGASAAFLSNAPDAKLDMMFTGWIVASLAAWMTRPNNERLSPARSFWLWGALAAAMLTKGPLAILIVISVVLAECLFARSPRPFLNARPLMGLIIVGGLTGIWLYMQGKAAGASFVEGQVKGETVDRLLHGDHAEPFWYYIPRIFTAIYFPWAFLLIPIGIFVYKKRKQLDLGRLVPLVGWFAVPFLVLCLAHGKRQTYMLPLIPSMSLFVAWGLEKITRWEDPSPRLARTIFSLSILSGILLISVGIFSLIRPDILWNQNIFITIPCGIGAIVLGFGALGSLLKLRSHMRTNWQILHTMVGLVLFMGLADYIVMRPAINPIYSTRAFGEMFTRDFAKSLPESEAIAAFGSADKPEFHAYHALPLKPFEKKLWKENNATSLPTLLLFRGDDIEQFNEQATAKGYRKAWEGIVTDERLGLFEKGAPQSPLGLEDRQLSFVLVGDTGENSKRQYRLADQMVALNAKTPIDAMLLLGDQVYVDVSTIAEGLDQCLVGPYGSLIGSGVDVHATLGNHDYSNKFSTDELNSPALGMGGKRYYSVTYGDKMVTFFMLDSATLEHDPYQYVWFKNELEACTSHWKILLIHTPLQASNVSHGANKRLYQLLKPVILGKNDIDVVFAGHNHIYERLRPHEGIVHITAGAGSVVSKGPFPPNEERIAYDNDKCTFVNVRFEGENLIAQTIDEDGKIVDNFVLRDLENPHGIEVVYDMASNPRTGFPMVR